jgi:hypothetical protein
MIFRHSLGFLHLPECASQSAGLLSFAPADCICACDVLGVARRSNTDERRQLRHRGYAKPNHFRSMHVPHQIAASQLSIFSSVSLPL